MQANGNRLWPVTNRYSATETSLKSQRVGVPIYQDVQFDYQDVQRDYCLFMWKQTPVEGTKKGLGA